MKKNKIKQMAKLVARELKREGKTQAKEEHSLRHEFSHEWSEYDPEVSEKFKKMILHFSNWTENLQIKIYEERIWLSIPDIKSVKSGTTDKLTKEDDYVEMTIWKDIGFTINSGYKTTSAWRDSTMFSELHTTLTEKLKEENSRNFQKIWTELMRESGLLRDINLQGIFTENTEI